MTMVDAHASSTRLYAADGVSYHIAGTEYGDAMTRLLASSFTHEPMGRALGLTAAELHEFVSRFVPECTVNGLSVIAVSERSPDELVGVSLNRDFKSPLPPGVPDDFARFAPIFAALSQVDEQYEAQLQGVQLGQALQLWMVGVELSGGFTRRGVGGNLFRVSAQLAADRAFHRCLSECTSYFSQRCALRAGFDERTELMYKDFLFDGLPVFAAIPEPHLALGLYERILPSGPWP